MVMISAESMKTPAAGKSDSFGRDIVGRGSHLEDTFKRAEKLIGAERIYTDVSRAHLEHAEVRAN